MIHKNVICETWAMFNWFIYLSKSGQIKFSAELRSK